MKCKHCGNCYHWKDAFSKFGYDDGDGKVETPLIAEALENAGYSVEFSKWFMHNELIYSIKKSGIEFMPRNTAKYLVGYDDPQEYLPVAVIKLLEQIFPAPILFR